MYASVNSYLNSLSKARSFFFIRGGVMNKIFSILISSVLLFIAGCNSIGNGMPKVFKINVESPEVIDIEGDWHVEIVCNANENTCEVVIDENLSNSFSVSGRKKFNAYLPRKIQPMVAPVLRLKMQKSFRELKSEGNNICTVRNFNSEQLAVEVSDGGVYIFRDCNIGKLELEVNDIGKVSFKGLVKNIEAEITDRAAADIEKVEKLQLECSKNSICRVNKCGIAKVRAKDMASVIFREIQNVDSETVGNAVINIPVKSEK